MGHIRAQAISRLEDALGNECVHACRWHTPALDCDSQSGLASASPGSTQPSLCTIFTSVRLCITSGHCGIIASISSASPLVRLDPTNASGLQCCMLDFDAVSGYLSAQCQVFISCCSPRARKQTRKTHFGRIDCAHSAVERTATRSS